MSSEEQARRRRELIERLNAEERRPTREELEEREHQEELEESTRKHPWFYLAMVCASFLSFGGIFSLATRHQYSPLPLVLGFLVGAVLTHFAFRQLTWVLDNKAKLIWVVALAGVIGLFLAKLLILPSSVGGDPTFRGSYGLLLGVVCIAGLRAGHERSYSP